MRELLAVGIGGSVGAIARYLLSGWVQRVAGPAFPWGTLTVNLVGCLVLGALMRLSETRFPFGPEGRLFLGIGVLGSLTTFSAFGYETLELLRSSGSGAALGNAVANLVLGCAAVIAGRALVSWLGG